MTVSWEKGEREDGRKERGEVRKEKGRRKESASSPKLSAPPSAPHAPRLLALLLRGPGSYSVRHRGSLTGI